MCILCILLLLVFIFQLFLYGSMYRSMANDVRRSNEYTVSSVAALADARFSALADTVVSLSWDRSVLSTVVFPVQADATQRFQVIQALKSFTTSNSLVRKTVLVALHSGDVYTSTGQISTLDGFQDAPDLSAPTAARLDGDACELVRTENGDICLQYQFIAGSYGYLGKLLVYLDTGPLFAAICDGNANLSVYSSDDVLLYPAAPAQAAAAAAEAENQENITVSAISASGLQFHLIYPRTRLSLGAFGLSDLWMLLLLLPLLFLLALFTAWILYRPLHRLSVSLENAPTELPESEGGDEWAYLHSAISGLSTKASRFDSIITAVSPHIQKELLVDLLEGASPADLSVSSTLSSLQDPFPTQGTFLLFLVRDRVTGVFASADLDRAVRRLEDLSCPGCRFLPFAYRYTVLTLVSLPDAFAETLIADLEQAVAARTRGLANRVVCRSAPFFSLADLRTAYHQSVQAAPDSELRDVAVPEICRAVREAASQSEEAGMIIIDTLLSRLSAARYSQEELQLCYRALLNTLDELAREYSVKGSASPDAPDALPPEELPILCRSRAAVLLHEIFSRQDNRQHKYFTEAKDYLEAHYTDYDLSLNSLAAHIGISPSYLSRILTSAYGMKFTQKLNELRVEKSKELLADETRLIRDISAEVGFLTVQNFMRVFKQRTGVTPSEYRLALSDGKPGPR